MDNGEKMRRLRQGSKRQLHSGSSVERSKVPSLVVRPAKRSLEKDLLSQVKKILDIFSIKGVLSYRRIHVMPIQINRFRCRPNTDMQGIEDIQVYLLGGKTLYWELKSNKGKQSDAQIVRENELVSLGHHYRVIRTLDQAISELAAFGFYL